MEIEDITEILTENKISVKDLQAMLKILPNGTYNFEDLCDIYGIQSSRTLEDAGPLAKESTRD